MKNKIIYRFKTAVNLNLGDNKCDNVVSIFHWLRIIIDSPTLSCFLCVPVSIR